MPHALKGISKSRAVCAADVGPPKGPAAVRVSAMRHGVMGTNCVAAGVGVAIVALTFKVTVTVCGEFVAPGARTEIVLVCAPAFMPVGFTDTVNVVPCSD